MKDLETELAVVSESHARLESELAESKALASRAEDLSEQLGTVEAELAALKLEPAPSPSGDLETLLQDLDTLTRERNRLAAEVAALKSTGTRPDSV
jgi:DNA repair exonuclease SbcCD ATPase subunit